MPDEPDANWPPGAENEPSEALVTRPAPLERSDKSDVGCMLFLLFMLIGVFLLPLLFVLGLALPLLFVLLLALATPLINPLERRRPPAKWWGRAITFLFLAGLMVAAWFWIRSIGETPPEPDS